MTSLRLTLQTWLTVALLTVALLSSPLVVTCVAGSARPKPQSSRRPDRAKPALARLSQIKVTGTNDGVLIEWRTDFEIDNLGFNVYRERNGRRTRINPGIIAGSALIVGQGTPLQAGFSYSWLDRGGTLDCKYYLEDVDLSGQSSWHPAGMPEWSANLPNRGQSQMLADLGASTGSEAAQTEWAGAEQNSSLPTSGSGIVPGAIADPGAIANQPALKIGVKSDGWYRITQAEMAAAGFVTSGNARNLRMLVGDEEIAIRVSRESGPLTSADYVEFWGERLDLPSTDTQIYWLLNGPQAGRRIVPVGETPGSGGGSGSDPGVGNNSTPQPSTNVTTAPGADFPTPTEALPDTQAVTGRSNGVVATPGSRGTSERRGRNLPLARASARNIPAISVKSSKGRPGLAKRSGALRSIRSRSFKQTGSGLGRNDRRIPSRSLRRNHANVLAAAVPTFIYTVERKDRVIYYPAAQNGEAENFFGHTVTPTSNPFTMTIHNIENTSTVSAQLQVSLRGVSSQNHQVNAFVNDSLIGIIDFSSVNPVTQSLLFSPSLLIDGDNQIKLVAVGGSNDVSLIDYLRLVYPHRFRADNNSLQFTLNPTQSARIDGFTSANIRVLDLSNLNAVQEVRPTVLNSGPGYTLAIPAGQTGKARRLVALPDTQFLHPASLTRNQPSSLIGKSNAADLLIIAYKDFIPALGPLVSQRKAQGFKVVVANVEDVYDELSHGVHTPQAIKDFLWLTRSGWAKAPRYLLLVGDASYDARNYTGRGMWDLVPSKPVDTFYMETSSDDSLADFDNDGLPEMSVGRLPARTVAEANLMISKIVNFNPASVPQTAMMVADKPIDYDFEHFSEQLIPLLPGSLSVQRVYRAQQPSDTATRAAIINNFNAGQVLVNYSGHGNIDVWGGSIFTSTDALALTNGNRLPFVFVMDCLNGFFASPALEGLAESLLKAPNGGAVASFASSGLTIADPQHAMGRRMFQLLYSGPPIAIGDASRLSKSATNDLDVRRTWILFGDPTMKIR
jgi:hypothetical protein